MIYLVVKDQASAQRIIDAVARGEEHEEGLAITSDLTQAVAEARVIRRSNPYVDILSFENGIYRSVTWVPDPAQDDGKPVNVGNHIGYFKIVGTTIYHSFELEGLPWHSANSMLGQADAFASLLDYMAFVALVGAIEEAL